MEQQALSRVGYQADKGTTHPTGKGCPPRCKNIDGLLMDDTQVEKWMGIHSRGKMMGEIILIVVIFLAVFALGCSIGGKWK